MSHLERVRIQFLTNYSTNDNLGRTVLSSAANSAPFSVAFQSLEATSDFHISDSVTCPGTMNRHLKTIS